jgi:formylglycine-generating enzyme required for sulfatase activity
VAKALSNHAEAVYGKLSEQDRKQAQQIFLQLVRPGEGTEDTRRVASRGEVGNWELVTFLAGEEARLVVTGREEQTGEETVEVVHEVLIREWGQLRGWMDENRSFRTWQERLRAAMRQWKATDKDDGALLRGVVLAEAQEWWNRRLDEMSQKEQDFIHSSLELQEREKRQKELQHKRELDLERNRRYLAQGLAAVLGTIAISATGILAYPYLLRWQATSLVKIVNIPAGNFEMEVYEVSNEQYHLCVAARACERPKFERRRFDDKNKSKHPVVGVSAVQAADYCRWLGRRLPTELEWEQAARGNQDKGRLWPWGNTKPTHQHANIILSGENLKSTVPVSNNPDGGSPEGVYNLVGNVWEWTSSYFNESYLTSEQKQVWNGEEQNLDDRDQLVIRGGSWKDEMESITNRSPVGGHDGNDFVGIRCVR